MCKKNILILLGLTLLSGCDTVRSTLGLQRTEPDEFNVIDRHPLTTPPGYGLRPPQSGQENVAIIDPHAKAQQSLTGQSAKLRPKAPQSAGEKMLLENISKNPSNQDIRTVINNEQQASQDAVNSRLSSLSKSQTDNKELIDPHAEYEQETGHAHPSKFLEEVN